jgi:hypothetical protein
MSDKKTNYEGFDLRMALVDAVPVLLFLAGGILLFCKLGSPVFLAGALFSTAAGACKVAWKFVLALRKKDAAVLPKLFRVLMPTGFVLMLLSVFLSAAAWGALVSSLLAMPSLVFLLLGCAGILLMTVFAFRLDKNDPRSNWLEQFTNAAAQAMFLLALLLA